MTLGLMDGPSNLGLTLIIQVSHTPRHVTPVQPEYWENPSFTGQVNLYTGPG